jgi:hypothetical protein
MRRVRRLFASTHLVVFESLQGDGLTPEFTEYGCFPWQNYRLGSHVSGAVESALDRPFLADFASPVPALLSPPLSIILVGADSVPSSWILI